MFWTKDSHLVGYTQHTHLKWLGFGCDLVKIAMCYRVYVYASLLPFFMPFGGTVSYVFGPPCFCENQGTETKENINMKTITVPFSSTKKHGLLYVKDVRTGLPKVCQWFSF